MTWMYIGIDIYAHRCYIRIMNETQINELRLADYDLIIVNSSAGKDSQAMLDYVVELADRENVRGRIVVAHADLGRVEWQGTAELAERQAKHYGLRFEKIARPQGDLLDHIEKRGMFPDAKNRYCTSDHKRGQISKIITKAHRESGKQTFKVLNCLGIRSQESAARAKKVPFENDKRNSTKSRTVDIWYPIFTWTVEQVWQRIRASGVEYHPAYDLGMPRLSCVFCVFAPKHALQIAAKHNPELLDEYIRVENKIGHKFRNGFSIAEVKEAAATGTELVEDVREWNS